MPRLPICTGALDVACTAALPCRLTFTIRLNHSFVAFAQNVCTLRGHQKPPLHSRHDGSGNEASSSHVRTRASSQLSTRAVYMLQGHRLTSPGGLLSRRYEKSISMKLAMRSELLKPLDLRRGEEVDGRARKLQERTLPKTRSFAYVSSHVPKADGIKRSRSVEPWRVIASEPIDNFVERQRSASAMEGTGNFGQRVNSWLPPIVRNRISTSGMQAVREGLAAERDKPRVRIDPETKQLVSRRDETAQELPDEMATIRDASASEHAQHSGGEPSRARKMMKAAITKSYKERLRRYGEEWHKADKTAPRPLGDGPSLAEVAVQAMRKYAKEQQLEYTVLGEL